MTLEPRPVAAVRDAVIPGSYTGVRMRALTALALLLALACAAPGDSDTPPSPETPPTDGAYALVLGTAQDGGLPQIGCERPCCEAARADPSRRRLVASLLLVDADRRSRFLIDATPDLPEQLELAGGHPPERAPYFQACHLWPPPPKPEGRRAPFDLILLTHAHFGHYAGLAHLGTESFAAQYQFVRSGPRLAAFLEGNEPFATMVREHRLFAQSFEPNGGSRLSGDLVFHPPSGEAYEVRPRLSVEFLAVPHRDELSETLAFIIRGPQRSLLYLPDIDAWERWDRSLAEVLAGVDVALIDGTFYDTDELPGRDPSAFPHPTIRHTLELLAPLPASERAKVLFTHLNHSNPAADPDSAAAAAVRAAGCGVAREAQVIPL